jgi:hypothetical protein
MESTFQSEDASLPNRLEITPVSESSEGLSLLDDESDQISTMEIDSGDEENSTTINNVVELSSDLSIQPASESLQALPEEESDDLSLPELASIEPPQELASTDPPQELASMEAPIGHQVNPTSLFRPSAEPVMKGLGQTDPQREFAESIRNGNYVEAVATVVSKLCHLEIVTIVEDEDCPPSSEDLAHSQGTVGQRIITRMDLVGGDITKVIGKRFVERSEYKPLQDMHNQQVTEGLAIMKTNLDNLVKAINSLKSLTNPD